MDKLTKKDFLKIKELKKEAHRMYRISARDVQRISKMAIESIKNLRFEETRKYLKWSEEYQNRAKIYEVAVRQFEKKIKEGFNDE